MSMEISNNQVMQAYKQEVQTLVSPILLNCQTKICPHLNIVNLVDKVEKALDSRNVQVFLLFEFCSGKERTITSRWELIQLD